MVLFSGNSKWLLGQEAKTPPSHGGNTSSILVGVTIKNDDFTNETVVFCYPSPSTIHLCFKFPTVIENVHAAVGIFRFAGLVIVWVHTDESFARSKV